MFLVSEDRYNSLIRKSHKFDSDISANVSLKTDRNSEIAQETGAEASSPIIEPRDAFSHNVVDKLDAETVIAFMPLRLIARFDLI